MFDQKNPCPYSKKLVTNRKNVIVNLFSLGYFDSDYQVRIYLMFQRKFGPAQNLHKKAIIFLISSFWCSAMAADDLSSDQKIHIASCRADDIISDLTTVSDNQKRLTIAFTAVISCNRETVSALIMSNRFDPMKSLSDGTNILHAATYNIVNPSVIDEVIGFVDLKSQLDAKGRTPLDVARANRNDYAVKMLSAS